jgi:hypothetical protein
VQDDRIEGEINAKAEVIPACCINFRLFIVFVVRYWNLVIIVHTWKYKS